ncbi:MAG: hypothetical protein ACRDQ0_14235 [Pseudonocardia sp.]
MSYGWGAGEERPDPTPSWQVQHRRARVQVVKDVVERGMSPLAAAMTWGVLVEDVRRWLRWRREDASESLETSAREVSASLRSEHPHVEIDKEDAMPATTCADPIESVSVIESDAVTVPRMDECPRGGNHDWRYSGHIRTCNKCGTSENAE